MKSILRWTLFSTLGLGVSILVTSCVAPQTGMDLGIRLETGSQIDVGDVGLAEGAVFEVDAVGLMREAMDEALLEKGIFWAGNPEIKHYTLSIVIKDYEMGNAFKRWLIPMYGATNLVLQCELYDATGNESVAQFEHKRTVGAGGLYSIGAWKSIYKMAAKDIANDLERRISGNLQGFYIEVAPWPENETEVPKSAVPTRINLLSIVDSRPEKGRIGERTAAFNVSMGNVYLNRSVPDYLYEAIQNELMASGNEITDTNPSVSLQGEIKRFWVYTDTTALYWDVIAELELELSVIHPESMEILGREIYSGQAKKRTYIYPTKAIASGVLDESIQQLMYAIRGDSLWTKVE